MSLRRSMMFSLGGFDTDALAFIAAHEANTGLTMGSVQKIAVNNRYKRYKNIIPTPNGSDLWTVLNAPATKPRIWIHCPIDDATANASAYQIEFISKTPLGTFNNFVAGNFTPQGVIGGSTKYFDSGITANSYPQTSVGFGVYCRTNSSTTTLEVGSNSGSFYFFTKNGTTFGWRINDTTSSSVVVADSLGLFVAQRSGTNKQAYKNGASIASVTVTSAAPATLNIFFHAGNNGTTPQVLESARQLSGYFAGLPFLTANEMSDLYWIEQLYQTEIITGGRQV